MGIVAGFFIIFARRNFHIRKRNTITTVDMTQGNIYLDNIIFSLQKTGGISIVWYELLNHFMHTAWREKLRFLEYDQAENNLFRKHLNLPEGQIIRRKHAFMPLQRYFNPNVSCKENFLFHSSYYRTCPNHKAINITTVHDFTYEHFMHGITRRLHSYQKYNAIRHATHIVCVSGHTKKDLLHFMPEIDPDSISVIYNGVSKEYHRLPTPSSETLPYADSPYVLFVGSRVSYKNFKLTVRALRDTGLKLIIVGNPLTPEETNMLNEQLGGQYTQVGRISNKQLNELYNSAYCLLYPSSYEGFGIPVLEAQKAGCPVIASNSSSIPEIIGDKTLLLKEPSVDEIHRCLSLLRNPSIRDTIIQKGMKNAERFTWAHTFAQIEKLYAQFIEL